MNDGNEQTASSVPASPASAPALPPPRPKVEKMHWPYPLIWLVPVLAAIAAGVYFYQQKQDEGPVITIHVHDGSALKVDQTTVNHLGVPIGKLIGLALSPDAKQVELTVQLKKSASAFAKTGTVYWVVRPQVSITNIQGLDAITTGPYLESSPGDGPPVSEFDGLERAPSALQPGLHIVLHAPRVERAQPDAPVYYRGVQVGIVDKIDLSSDATGIDVHCLIYWRYMPLVRTDSKFWVVKGIDLQGGLFSGVQMKVDSLRSIVAGGVTFATPDTKTSTAPQDSQFPLYDEPEKKWTDWSPAISLLPAESPNEQNAIGVPEPTDAVKSAVGGK
jgi:paraquat-inducible protein B